MTKSEIIEKLEILYDEMSAEKCYIIDYVGVEFVITYANVGDWINDIEDNKLNDTLIQKKMRMANLIWKLIQND